MVNMTLVNFYVFRVFILEHFQLIWMNSHAISSFHLVFERHQHCQTQPSLRA
jgi:hypothetical protein